MNHRRVWIPVTVFALLAAAGGAVAQEKSDSPAPSLPTEVSSAVAAVAGAFTRDSQAYDLLTELTSSIGQRLTATRHGAAAERFVYGKLKKFGYDPHYEPFPIRSWTRGTLDLEVDGKRIAAAAFVDTPARANVATELVDVGNGTVADYADPDRVRGRIALVYTKVLPGSPADTPTVRRSDKLALAVAHGAAGVIFINQRPGDNLVTGSAGRNGAAGADAELVTVPVLSVGHDTGLQLKDALAKHTAHADIRMTNSVAPGFARNVVATLKGSEFPDEYVVLGGHLDCLDLATGAVDDGTGAMWVLDVARGLKAHHFKPRRSIRFIFFMGEEQGMVGSYAYVDRAERNGTLGKIKYMVNTDMSVNPTGYNLWSGDPDMRFFDALAGTVRKYYPSFVTGASIGNPNGSQSSDSQPFIERGIPIAYPTPTWAEDMLRCVHADCDTMKWVTREDLRRSAGMGAMLVAALADSAHAVASVFSVSQTQTYLRSQGIEK